MGKPKRVFSYGRTPSAVPIYVLFRDGSFRKLSGKYHVVYYDSRERTKGHLKDGRPVVYIDGKWVYISK